MTTMNRALVMFVGVVCVAGVASSAFAAPNDMDGKRTRARKATLGTAIEDRVGPNDLADWRYLRVEAPGTLTVTLKFDPKAASPALNVFDAKGKLLAKGTVDASGGFVASVQVSPGIYYIEVAAPSAVTYTLEAKMGR